MNALPGSSSVSLFQKTVIRIPRPCLQQIDLSVPSWDDLIGRGGIVRDRPRAAQIDPAHGALPLYDHAPNAKPHYVAHLEALGLWPIRQPLCLLGARNLGNNLRVCGWRAGRPLLQLRGENAEAGQRLYYGLCHLGEGRLEAHQVRFDGDRVISSDGTDLRPEWVLTGQPLLWQGSHDADEVLRNTYDLRHSFSLGGLNPDGTHRETGGITAELIELLVQTDDPAVVRNRAMELRLGPEAHYLHSALGLTADGDVVLCQAHGSFEDLASDLKSLGCVFAFELDEGGSVSSFLAWNPSRVSALDDARLMASHYFRAKATALLVLRLQAPGKEGQATVPIVEDSALGRSREVRASS